MSTFALLAAFTQVAGSVAVQEAAKPQGAPKTYFLNDARVVVRPGQILEKADIILKDGKIAQIAASLTAPDGAETIECEGLTAYPGLIHPFLRVSIDGVAPSNTGLTPAQIAARRDADPFGRANSLLSAKKIAEISQKDVSAFGSLAKSGYGLAQLCATGGLLGAQSAIVNLSNPGLETSSVVASQGFIPASVSSRGGFGSYPGSAMGVIAFVRQGLFDAQRYTRLRAKANASGSGNGNEKGSGPSNGSSNGTITGKFEVDPALEALERVTSGATRAVFDDLGEVTYFQARKITNEFELKPVYGFRSGAGWVADLLRDRDAAVFLKGDTPSKPNIGENLDAVSLASVRTYFNEIQAGAELEKKGVAFCYSPNSTSDPLSGIRTYVRAGLSRDSALAAMTTLPAELLGVADKTGTIEVGKLGNVLLAQGDLFDSTSQIMAVWVSGKRIDFKMPDKKKPEDLKADAPLPLAPTNYEPFPKPAETKTAFRLYRNATIWTEGPLGTLTNADILIRDGKIIEVGKNVKAPAGCEIIDATGKHISPGIWDCHSHTGISGGVNEGSNMVTVECRIADVIDHRQIGIYRQLSGGTVGAQQLHGSANAIGGQTSPVKWRWGERPTEFPIKGAPPGVKFALGQNPIREDPERRGPGAQDQPDGTTLLTFRPRTRMGVEEAIRRALQLGKEYAETWEAYRQGKITEEPRRDIQLEGLAEIVAGKRLIHSHAYRQDEMLMLIRVTKEFGAKLATLQHVLEGYKIADEMAAAGVGGSTFSDWWGYKLEAYDAIPYNAALMAERGVSVSVNSDSDNHARRLNQEAAKSMRYGGVSAEKALSFVTIEPAKQMGIADHTGSLEVGKDADIAIWNTDPLSIYAVCLETYVDGIKRFDRADDQRQREQRVQELLRDKQLLTETNNPFTSGPTPAKPDVKGNTTAAKFGLGPVTGKAGTSRYPRKAVLITGATVHPMVGDPFVGDVLIGADGMIQSVGKGLSGGAVRVDGRGKHLYPGLIDPSTTLGINEIGQVPASNDSSEKGDFHPDYRVERTINPEWETLGVARQQGVLTALVHPAGSGICGQAALVNTEGYTWEDLCVQSGIAMAVGIGGGGFGFGEEDDDADDMSGAQGRQTVGDPNTSQDEPDLSSPFASISSQLEKTRDYLAKRASADPAKPVPYDARYEALAATLKGRTPFLISVNTASDIRSAVSWAEKENVRVLLYGCSGAGEIADWLVLKKVPIILSAVFGMPEADRPTEFFYALPAQLTKAGVRYCLSTNDSYNVRQLRDQAGFAAAFGLNREDAVRAMTLWTAEMLGASDRIGAIKPGLEGTLILTDGDILETRTHVTRAWIAGREVDLTNKQTRLYEKYRNRPKP